MRNLKRFIWSDSLLLGYGPIDNTHKEFVNCLSILLAAEDNHLLTALGALVEHLERHFREENDWMLRTNFPATDCHIEEHSKVLESANELLIHLQTGGDNYLCRSFSDALMNWFPGHAEYMDAPLAQWMSKLSYGGIPVVLKRK